MSFLSRLVSWLRGDRARPAEPASHAHTEAELSRRLGELRAPKSEPVREVDAGRSDAQGTPAPGGSPQTDATRDEQTAEAAPPRPRKPKAPQAAPVEDAPAAVAAPALAVRIGIDFGTSTTQVAVRVGDSEPYLIEMEPGRENMPSYVARREDGTFAFGTDAMNLPVNVHSIKPMLDEDPVLDDLGGLRASDGAKALLEEVVGRTLRFLKAQRLVGDAIDTLEVATVLGTTPRFGLDTRVRLRDIANEAGIKVRLADLIEEPVAAAFELVYGGTASDGRIMVVDVGGGTLDIAILRSDLGAGKMELFATRGARTAGDRFTKVIEDRLRTEVNDRAGRTVELDRRSTTLIWSRAESAKLSLAAAREVVVPLGGVGGLEEGDLTLERTWYETACSALRLHLLHEVKEAYRQARLILDRGGDGDPSPGTMLVRMAPNGATTRLTDGNYDLAADAREHLDAVIPVGGGSLSPIVRTALESLFGGLVRDPFVDPVGAIALGLARGDSVNAVNLRYPNWGILARFGVDDSEIPLYEPFASTLTIRGGQTSVYTYDHPLPEGARGIRIVFRPVGPGEAALWPALPIPAGVTHVRLGLDLFGRVNLMAIGPRQQDQTYLLADHDDLHGPWMPNEGERVGPWVPKPKDRRWWDHVPQWNWLEKP